MNENNVILIGFMGAGKTTVGRRLSYLLKKPFLDLDSYIENEEERRIKQIFDENGELYFRNLETHVLKKIKNEPWSHVISVGGGAPIREENQKLLKKMGIIVYLRVKPTTVLKRIKYDVDRPLLQVANPKEKIIVMMKERDPIYSKIADVIIDVDKKTFRMILKELKKNLHKDGDKN
jgi:shikimate dehydrogenase/shikimate kinase